MIEIHKNSNFYYHYENEIFCLKNLRIFEKLLNVNINKSRKLN